MNLLDIILLGFIQGITEFLPISSTGHLIIVEKFLNFSSFLCFDAFIHLGSFSAIVIYFFKDLKEIWLNKWLILIASLPGALTGLLLENIVESYFRSSYVVALALILMCIPMILGEVFGKKKYEVKDLSYARALLIGIFQALALIPGTSRSGITISAGLLVGLKRDISAKFSFFAGAPLILGAGLYEGLKLFKETQISFDLALAGFFSSAIFSFLAIAFLIPFLRKYSLYPFIGYRIFLGIIILLGI